MPDRLPFTSAGTANPSLLTDYISAMTDCLLPLTEVPLIGGEGMRQEKELTEFGQWLMPRLKSRNLNREQFARLCGVGSSLVAKWLFSTRPSPASCELIAGALRVDVTDVLVAAGHPVGYFQSAVIGEIRTEAQQLIELMPEALLLPYVIGMRAIVSHGEPAALVSELRGLIEEEEDGDKG